MRSPRCPCSSCDPSALLASPTELLSATAFDVSSVHALCLRVRLLEEQIQEMSSEGVEEIEDCLERMGAVRDRLLSHEKLGKGKY